MSEIRAQDERMKDGQYFHVQQYSAAFDSERCAVLESLTEHTASRGRIRIDPEVAGRGRRRSDDTSYHPAIILPTDDDGEQGQRKGGGRGDQAQESYEEEGES